jgi:uncharacterized membrane protein
MKDEGKMERRSIAWHGIGINFLHEFFAYSILRSVVVVIVISRFKSILGAVFQGHQADQIEQPNEAEVVRREDCPDRSSGIVNAETSTVLLLI